MQESTSLFYNFYLYSKPQSRAWIYCQNGRIASLGEGHPPKGFRVKNTYDLLGGIVHPGFIDAHIHLHLIGETLLRLNFTHCRRKSEVLQKIQAELRKKQPPKFISGFGWDETQWDQAQSPTRSELDALSKSIPILIARIDSHCSIANSALLKIYEKKYGLRNPPGGALERDSQGNLSGKITETAHNLAWDLLPTPSSEELEKQLLWGQQECLKAGITVVHDVAVSQRNRMSYEALAAKNKLKVFSKLAVWGDLAIKNALKDGPYEFKMQNRCSLFGVKFFLDGTLGSRTALLDEPYADDPENLGQQICSPADLKKQVRATLQHGFQPLIHAIGPKANALAIDVYESCAKYANKKRMRIEHAEVMSPTDITRAHAVNIVLSIQPSHIISDQRWLMERLGEKRAANAGAWRSMRKSKLNICGGSDAPIDEIFPVRSMVDACYRPDFYPKECLRRSEALRLYTESAAFAAHMENNFGKIRQGFLCNLSVLDENVLFSPWDSLKKSKVLMTVIAGRPEFNSL